MVPFRTAGAWGYRNFGGTYGRTLVDILTNDVAPDAPLVACLCATNHAGRLFGLRAPALLLAAPVGTVTNRRAWVAERLDRLNAAHGMSLMAAGEAGDGAPLILSHIGSPEFQRLKPGERPALTFVGSWLVFSSSSEVLSQLLGNTNGVAIASVPRIVPGRDDAPYPDFVLRADLEAARESLVKAVAVYDLMNYGNTAARRAPGRRATGELLEWLEDVGPLNRLLLSVRFGGPEVEAYLRMDTESPGTEPRPTRRE
jgi:hypothetical protein